MMKKEKLTYRSLVPADLEIICKFPQSEQELFFMCPKADYPLSIEQFINILKHRFEPTVVLLDNEIVGFANFYEVKDKQYCAIGNVIINSDFRNRGIGIFLITIMEDIARTKYNVSEIHLSCFAQTLPDTKQALKAVCSFKDEYLLDFINVEELNEQEEDLDEKIVEKAIVANVKKFIMTFGQDFSFIGNQYRMEVAGEGRRT